VTATADKLRIGEVAELTGTTPRTIRYYEEIRLLPGSGERAQGQHRTYSQADVERLREIVRLKDLLGLSLEQLSTLLEAETARAEIRRELQTEPDRETTRRLLTEALGHIDTQLELVRARRRELEKLEEELGDRRRRAQRRLRELS
jgi:DNA-binding transcriptional MerR regulator